MFWTQDQGVKAVLVIHLQSSLAQQGPVITGRASKSKPENNKQPVCAGPSAPRNADDADGEGFVDSAKPLAFFLLP